MLNWVECKNLFYNLETYISGYNACIQTSSRK